MTHTNTKVVITGAAGLVGQNLVVEMKSQGYTRLVAIDKHQHNLGILRRLHPEVEAIDADLASPGDWRHAFEGAACVVQLQAQITSKYPDAFVRNNLESTRQVLDAMREYQIPYLVHVISSVVNSVADDDYTQTKRAQEKLVAGSGIAHCILRPTLMFGWFDPKHLGWLSRFMEKTPIFPIPGNGRFMRQPLYERDFCRCLIKCIEREPNAAVYNICGDERINYIDIIRTIKRVKGLRTLILPIPFALFRWLLRTYSLISRQPPFTVAQLDALSAGDDFTGIDTWREFGVPQTTFEDAIRETFGDSNYSNVVLDL